MGRLSTLTYNVLFNKAVVYLEDIVKSYQPDILCLQEVETDDQNLKRLQHNSYRLADYSNSFFKYGKIYGVATLYNEEKLQLVQSDALNLPKSVYEILLTILRILTVGNKPRTILRTDFRFRANNKIITTYNVHLSSLATNNARAKQLEKVLKDGMSSDKIATVITGDFNYVPYQRKALELLTTMYGFEEATKNILFTYFCPDGKKAQYNLMQRFLARIVKKFYNNRLKMDYTFYKGLKLKKTERVEVDFSDHYPIISYFNL